MFTEVAPPAGRPAEAPVPAARPRPRRRRGRHPQLKVSLGLGIVVVFLLLAIIGPTLSPDDPSGLGASILSPPSGAHWLGTTNTGQDVLSELLTGARSTIEVGLIAGVAATVLSIIFGVSAGYFEGISGELLSMLSNIFLVIPALPLLIVLTAFVPHASQVVIAVFIAITGWAWGARVMRAQTLSLRQQDFVQAAKAVGEPAWRIIFWELLPNEGAIVASSFLFTVIAAVLADAGLLFLGLGDVNVWSWGSMLYWAQNNEALSTGAWWWFVPPGLCIALFGTGLALCNFGIDEMINPRLRAAGLSRSDKRAMTTGLGVTPVHRVVRPRLAFGATAPGALAPVAPASGGPGSSAAQTSAESNP